jgi:hypothetical protein
MVEIMTTGEKTKSSRGWLKTAGAVALTLVVLLLLGRFYLARSGLVVIYAGGTASVPRAVAGSIMPDVTTPDSRFAKGKQQLLVFSPDAEDPIGTINVTGAARPIGAKGSRVWLGVQGRPFLIDVERGRAELTTGAIEDRHSPLANGFAVSSPAHSEFAGAFHAASGAIVVKAANKLDYVLTMQGSLTPWAGYVAEHPGGEPGKCRGGRSRVCGGEACVKLEPDPAGGERLGISDVRSADTFIGAELLVVEGCVPRVGKEGPLVISHQSKAGRGRPRDRITAVALDGTTRWSVSLGDLFGGRKLRSHRVGVGDDVVVVGAVVSHWLRGATVVVASIDAGGKVRAAR